MQLTSVTLGHTFLQCSIKRRIWMTRSLLSLEETAARLSVSCATLNRWHHAKWAAATDYEEVSVPRVGKVSARRWSASAVQDLVARTPELLARDDELRRFRQLCRQFGKGHARSLLEETPKPEPPLADAQISDVSIDDSDIPISVRDMIAAFLKQTHAWGTRTLKTEFDIVFPVCDLEVSWHQVSVREFRAPFNFESSSGGRKNGRYFVRVMAAAGLTRVTEFKNLFAPMFDRGEYDFIAKDKEIGSRRSLTAFELVLRTYLHEVSHAAATWLRDKGQSLPDPLICFEEAARSASLLELEEQARSGHNLTWSALYRALVRHSKIGVRRGLKR
jgi:hypothetical protein